MAEEAKEEAKKAQGGQQFVIQRLYVKDISFETPNSPAIFNEAWEPQIKVDMHTGGKALSDNLYEVELSFTVTATVKESTAFLVEVKHAGIFHIAGFEKPHLDHMIGSYCPSIIFPYVRETVSQLITKGGFPPLLLQPINFDAVYGQQLEQRKKQAESQAGGESAH